ncbi:MAG: efflux RND transporter periplasmic adaptor subunit [Wenzhouxiangella sp.]|jgi:HlyD family secretion protein|nr:efflux RND transporter periplasmic adaptor subunit [Wenzhouxiangella sp.]
MKKWAMVMVAVTVVAGLAWWQMNRQEPVDDVQIDRTALDRGDIVQIVSAVGSVRALNTVEVGSQLSGQIQELFADFNTPVKAGDLLARLDPQTFERRVQEAEANLAVARANVEIQTANIDKAEVVRENARREFDRQRSLVGRGSVSESALELAEVNFRNAGADVEIARAQLRNAQATVLQREAALEAARIDLERTEIRAPINGVVIDRAVDLGQTVAASLQAPVLFTIAQDLGQIRIEASVDEADIGNVRDGAEARFTVDAFPDREFSGQVAQVRLAPVEAQNVVTYTVVINAANPGRRLLPGMTASIDLVTGTKEDVLRVENQAVRFRPPDDLIAAAETGDAPSGGPGGGRNPGAEMAENLNEIGVGADTIATIQSEMRESFGAMRGLFQSGADPETIRQRLQDMSREVLARHLDGDQMAALTELQRERADTRRALLYTAAADGTLQSRPVRLGLSDDRYTEVVGSDLVEGEEVITRIRRPGSRG